MDNKLFINTFSLTSIYCIYIASEEISDQQFNNQVNNFKDDEHAKEKESSAESRCVQNKLGDVQKNKSPLLLLFFFIKGDKCKCSKY